MRIEDPNCFYHLATSEWRREKETFQRMRELHTATKKNMEDTIYFFFHRDNQTTICAHAILNIYSYIMCPALAQCNNSLFNFIFFISPLFISSIYRSIFLHPCVDC